MRKASINLQGSVSEQHTLEATIEWPMTCKECQLNYLESTTQITDTKPMWPIIDDYLCKYRNKIILTIK